MKARNKASHRILNAIDRFVQLLKSKDSPRSLAPRSKTDSTARVADELGNEYLCPLKDLKDPNFVKETEKANCIAYNNLSTRIIE